MTADRTDPVADYLRRHPKSCDPERFGAQEGEIARLAERGIPIGGPIGHSNNGVLPYPLVCVCAVPVPEWVYVAHQCATCKRVIKGDDMRGPDTTVKVWRVREQQTVTVPAWTTPTPGIVIHGMLNDAPDTYVVTHQRSGLMVAVTGCGCFTSSLSVAELLGDCGDWDRSGEEIRLDDEMRGRARDLLQSLGVDAAAPPVDDRHAEVRAEAMLR